MYKKSLQHWSVIMWGFSKGSGENDEERWLFMLPRDMVVSQACLKTVGGKYGL